MRFSTGLVVSLSVVGLAAALPEPQAPGSEQFECHSKCGGIITASRKDDFVSNCATHRADYAYCLSCAGPDAQNIWSMYGNSVSAAGEKCGWPTTPGADFPAEDDKEEETTTSAPAPETTTESTTTPVPAPTSTEVTSTTAAPVETPVEEEEEEEEEKEEEEETPAPTTTTVPVTTAPPVVNNGTVGGNSTNGVTVPTQPSDSAAGTKIISTGVIAAGFAAVAFLL